MFCMYFLHSGDYHIPELLLLCDNNYRFFNIITNFGVHIWSKDFQGALQLMKLDDNA